MYHRSRSAERRPAVEPVGFDFDPLSGDHSRIKGDGKLRKQTKSSKRALDSRNGNEAPLEGDFIGLEFKSITSKKASGAPMRAVTDKERSKDMEIKRSSPSLVARLMGLDTLPPSVAPYQQKERSHSSQRPPVGFHEEPAAYEGYSRRTRTDEYHKCKDVFEVSEKPNVKNHNNQPSREVMPSYKQSDKDMMSIKKKLMDSNYLRSNEALEVRYSIEAPPSHGSNITILTASERYHHNMRSRKSMPFETNQSHKERERPLACKLSDLENAGKFKDLLQPAEIVVLKPSLERGWGSTKAAQVARPSDRMYKQMPPISRTAEFYAEGRERQKLSKSMEVMRHKTRSSRRTTRNFDRLIEFGDNFSTSSSSSSDSVLTKEAKRQLSERWKTTHSFQEVGPLSSRSNTLGEMFASSDRDIPRTPSIVQNKPSGKVVHDLPLGISSKDGWRDEWSRNLPRSRSHPASLGYQNHQPSRRNRFGGSDRIYSNRSTADLSERNFRRRRSSSLKNFEYAYNDAQFYSGRGESPVSERDIHVNSEELRERISDRVPSQHVEVVPEVRNNLIVGEVNASGGRDQECDYNLPLRIDGLHCESGQLGKDVEFSSQDMNMLEPKEPLIEHPQPDVLFYQSGQLTTNSRLNSNELDHITEDPALEPLPSEEEKSSDCFEKINSDLQELRMQLRLLKLDTYSEDFQISSEEDNGGEFSEILKAFRDDEDRDYSYLLDLLIGSGVHDTNDISSLKYSLNPELFEKLEKKYGILDSWSRSERKFLFDLISYILNDIFSPFRNLHSTKSRMQPIFAREDLIENVWQMVAKRRKGGSGEHEELLLDRRWMDVGGDGDIIAKDLEKMIFDDIVEELYSHFFLE